MSSDYAQISDDAYVGNASVSCSVVHKVLALLSGGGGGDGYVTDATFTAGGGGYHGYATCESVGVDTWVTAAPAPVISGNTTDGDQYGSTNTLSMITGCTTGEFSLPLACGGYTVSCTPIQ